MSDFIRLMLLKMDQMQENEFLHLKNIKPCYSREIIKIADFENNFDLVLIEQAQDKDSIRNLINNLMLKKQERKLVGILCFLILKLLTEQLIELEESLIKPNLKLLTPDFVIYKPELPETHILKKPVTESIAKINICDIKWLILPDSLNFENLTVFCKDNDIWTYFITKDHANKNIYLNHRDLTQKAYFKDALNVLQNDIYPSQSDQEEKSIKKTSKRKNERKKLESLRNADKVSTSKINQKNKTTFFKKIFPNLKKSLLANTNYDNSATVPLNPQEDLFRLAMICEGPPGTIAENEGLKAFILIDEFLIGRDPAICDFILAEASIGRIHARISRHGSHYFLEDLGSVNGTSLDNKKLNKHQTYLLPDQCRLKFAERTFYFNID